MNKKPLICALSLGLALTLAGCSTEQKPAAPRRHATVSAPVRKRAVPKIVKHVQKKSIDAVAREIAFGTNPWGYGPDRDRKLRAAGYNPAAVARQVDALVANVAAPAGQSRPQAAPVATISSQKAGTWQQPVRTSYRPAAATQAGQSWDGVNKWGGISDWYKGDYFYAHDATGAGHTITGLNRGSTGSINGRHFVIDGVTTALSGRGGERIDTVAKRMGNSNVAFQTCVGPMMGGHAEAKIAFGHYIR